jgi:hypothetical protein
MKRLLAALLLMAICGVIQAQVFNPYPRANISEAQWKQYFDEVRQKHGTTAQDFGDQKLIRYLDEASNTFYLFTKLGHPAHPAWVASKPEQREDSLFINQIGYFAGDETPFAQLFRDVTSQNEKVKESIDRRRSSSETKGKPEHFVSSSNMDQQWMPSSEQKASLESAVSNYFTLHDKGQLEALYELHTPEAKRLMSQSQFYELHASGLTGSGAMNSRQVLRVSWYKDPQGTTGVFAAVNYETSYENYALQCGFVMFFAQPKGEYQITRSEANKIDKRTALRMSPEQLQNARKVFRC